MKQEKIKSLLARLDALEAPDMQTVVDEMLKEELDVFRSKLATSTTAKAFERLRKEFVSHKEATDLKPIFDAISRADAVNKDRTQKLEEGFRKRIQNVVREVQKSGKAESQALKSALNELQNYRKNIGEVLKSLETQDSVLAADVDSLRQTILSLEEIVSSSVSDITNVESKLADAIKESERVLNNRISSIQTGGGNQNRNISVNGNSSTLSKYTDINLVGDGVTIAVSTNDTTKQTNFTFSVPSGGVSLFASVSGTVNAVNTTFGYPSAPQAIVGDGVVYFEGNGYAYTASVITMDMPPSQYIKAMP